MNNVAKPLVLLAIVTFVFSSCTTFQLSGAQIAKRVPSYDKVGDFNTTVKVVEFLGASGGTNFANYTADAMDAKISEAIQGEIDKHSGDAAVNVDIRCKASFSDLLVNALTFTIVAPVTVHISGTIVKYN